MLILGWLFGVDIWHKFLLEPFENTTVMFGFLGEQLMLGLYFISICCMSLEAYFCYYCPAYGKLYN